ncbi:MAG: hypothetical protein WD556_12890 [Actinomycetota bacterium]
MTTSDSRNLLLRAAREVPTLDLGLADIHRRRHSLQRRRRFASGVGASAIGVVAMAVAASFLLGRSSQGPASVSEPPRILPPAIAAPSEVLDGQYYYARVTDFRIGGGEQSPEGTMTPLIENGVTEKWWAPDDSGRLRYSERDDKTFGPGELPRETNTSRFPTDPDELKEFLLERSQPSGASPAPVVSPPPGSDPKDGQLWRAITDLLAMPNVTPTHRAALLNVAAELRGAKVDLSATDPVGRPSYRISFHAVSDGRQELFVDPSSHELLAIRSFWGGGDQVGEISDLKVVEELGLADATDLRPRRSSIPRPIDPPSSVGTTG